MRRTIILGLALSFGITGEALAQQADVTDVEVGGGVNVQNYVTPGLEGQTPAAEPINPDNINLYADPGGQIAGRVSIPNDTAGVLVQPEGRTWRSFRTTGLQWLAAGMIFLTVGLLAGFFLWRGRIRIEEGRSGRWIPRFNGLERFTHWLTAISFLSLALTGLIVTFGRPLLIPLMGHASFTPLAAAAKAVHNASAAPFVIGIVTMLVLWVRDNIPNRSDITWFRQAGGMFNKPGTPHPEAERFNAGQKMIFWAVTLGGLAVAVTGFVLLMPFYFTGISGMQIIHVLHALIGVVLIAVIIAHVYIGTLGMEGAFDAMGRGSVDENWAKEHHRGWYDRIRRQPRSRADPNTTPAE